MARITNSDRQRLAAEYRAQQKVRSEQSRQLARAMLPHMQGNMEALVGHHTVLGDMPMGDPIDGYGDAFGGGDGAAPKVGRQSWDE